MKDLFKSLPNVNRLPAFVLLFLSLICLGIAIWMQPNTYYAEGPSELESNIPKEFGNWKLAPQLAPQVSLVSDNNKLQDQIYDDILMRSYINNNGDKVMLALAYAKEQRQDVKVHQPDICYPAQGYQMLSSKLANFKILANATAIQGKNQVYSGASHQEAVSYWVRVGDGTFLSGLQMRLKIISDGLLKQRFDDGMLVRVSSVSNNDTNTEKLFELHQQFLNDLTAALPTKSRKLLLPAAI
jgi:EpsI family protein